MSWLLAYLIVGWLIRGAMVPVILRRELAPGASIAWIGIIFLHPYIGLTLYLMVGETRLGWHRVARHRELVKKYRPAIAHGGTSADAFPAQLPVEYQPMALQAEKISSMPILCGNDIDVIGITTQFIDRLVGDIDNARSRVHLLYYIFAPDATGNRVSDAVIAAAKRGVQCRILVDAVAARAFFAAGGRAASLRAAGVTIAQALPVAPISRGLPRMDLRNHRKLSIIDDCIAYMGSHNLIDADYGGRRGAPWVDLTGRFTGPIVAELATVFAEDWAFESGEELEPPACPTVVNVTDGMSMQIVPTGPTAPGESYRRLLLGAIQCARSRLILTTPYFVPDEPTLIALMMAADRGVDVKLILPEKPDHLLTAAAGRAHFSRLLLAGISIHLYRPGLLHAKTVTIDDAYAIIGSANLDVRSFNLNFELGALLYGREATDRVRSIQMQYLQDSTPLDAVQWMSRSRLRSYTESAVSLFSPLL
jgi:cardiolipin synthase